MIIDERTYARAAARRHSRAPAQVPPRIVRLAHPADRFSEVRMLRRRYDARHRQRRSVPLLQVQHPHRPGAHALHRSQHSDGEARCHGPAGSCGPGFHAEARARDARGPAREAQNRAQRRSRAAACPDARARRDQGSAGSPLRGRRKGRSTRKTPACRSVSASIRRGARTSCSRWAGCGAGPISP